MTTHDPVPISPDGDEPLSDLFSDMRNLADQVASRISQDDVETRLHRVLRRAKRGPAGGDSVPLTVPFDPAEAILRGQTHSGLLEAQLREVQQAIVGARRELAGVGAEARHTLDLARVAYTEAEKARANAAKVVSEAKAYHDAALESAASIVKDARAAAEDITKVVSETKAYHDAMLASTAVIVENITKAVSEAKAYHDAALESAAVIVKDTRAAADDIERAARVVVYQRGGDLDGEQGFVLRDVVHYNDIGQAAEVSRPGPDQSTRGIRVKFTNSPCPEPAADIHLFSSSPLCPKRERWSSSSALREFFCAYEYAYVQGTARPEGSYPVRQENTATFMNTGLERRGLHLWHDALGTGLLSALAAWGSLTMPVVEIFVDGRAGWSAPLYTPRDSEELADSR